MARKTGNDALIARARKALTYDLQESNEFIHGVIRDLIVALGGNPNPPRSSEASPHPGQHSPPGNGSPGPAGQARVITGVNGPWNSRSHARPTT